MKGGKKTEQRSKERKEDGKARQIKERKKVMWGKLKEEIPEGGKTQNRTNKRKKERKVGKI